jgi:hypothetical protein
MNQFTQAMHEPQYSVPVELRDKQEQIQEQIFFYQVKITHELS